MTPRYVMHDGYRWHVDAEVKVDEEPGFELSRRVPVVKHFGNGVIERTVKMIRVTARERDCEADQHEPTRVIRNEHGRLRWNVKRGIFALSEPGRRKAFKFTMPGLLLMAARAEAMQKAAEKAHKRRVGKRGRKA